MLSIRLATSGDNDAIRQILEPVIRAGETYALPTDMTRNEALSFWSSPGNEEYVAEKEALIVGTYFLRRNQRGGGSHVANCGYITAQTHLGRGIARAMCLHSLARARDLGFRAMQYNFVISTNDRAVRLWQSL